MDAIKNFLLPFRQIINIMALGLDAVDEAGFPLGELMRFLSDLID
jgi:hypothetical protein